MMREHEPLSPARRFPWLTCCFALLGGCMGASAVISGAAVRTHANKLGVPGKNVFYVYVFSIPVYRTTVTGVGLLAQTQALHRAWSVGLTVTFTVIGALVGVAVSGVVQGLLACVGSVPTED